jgi:hypothetical protein
VREPSADSNGLLTHHFIQPRAVTPDPETLNSNKKGAKLPFLSAEGCHTLVEGQHCPLITYQAFFSRVEKPSADINGHLFLMNKKGLKFFLKYMRTKIGGILFEVFSIANLFLEYARSTSTSANK